MSMRNRTTRYQRCAALMTKKDQSPHEFYQNRKNYIKAGRKLDRELAAQEGRLMWEKEVQ